MEERLYIRDPYLTDINAELQHRIRVMSSTTRTMQTTRRLLSMCDTLRPRLVNENQITSLNIQQMSTHGFQCLQSQSTFFGLMDEEDGNQTNDNFRLCRAIKHPEYVDRTVRLESFTSWPKPFPDRTMMASAGLFYTGKSDLCRCFYCGYELSRWIETDNPVNEHLKNKHKCVFIRSLCFGEMHKADGGQPVRMHIANSKQSATDMHIKIGKDGPRGVDTGQQGRARFDPLVCKVCYTNDIGVTQLPCGHIICPPCARHQYDQPNNQYMECRICGKSVEEICAYDNCLFLKKA